jgi:hypothetical protein
VKAKNPPILANISSLIFTATKTIAPVNFINTGSPVVTCTVSPTLPSGIVIAPSGTTCAVSGTPAAAATGKIYTVSSSGEDTTISIATLEFTIEAAKPPVFSDLGDQNLTATVGITPVSFTNNGDPAISCSSSPTLPAGLQLDPISSTCKISGTPTTAKLGEVYKITGTASDGTVGSGNVYIAIAAASPPDLDDAGLKTGVIDYAFNTFTFTNWGYAATSCISVPDLPTGLSLSLDASSCKISGTPTVLTSATTFAVTAKAEDGSASTANIVISINTPNPPIFGTLGSQTFLLGYNKTVGLTNSGGDVSSCSTSPTLPGGLTATKSGNTCSIGGTPNTLSAIDTYTLTGVATDGTTGNKSFTLTVASPNPPILQSTTAQVWAKDKTIPGLEFTNLGAPATSCNSSPTLPSGLSVVPANNTCKIQGTPTSLTTPTNYSITATATDGSIGTVTINIDIEVGSPPALADAGNLIFDTGSTISPFTFDNTGPNALDCDSDKELPAGLTLSSNTFTCMISGTPTEFFPNIYYTITATASDNSTDTATIGISIRTPGDLSRKSTQRHLVYDVVEDMHWLFYRHAAQVKVAYSKDNTTWKTIETLSIASDDFSVAIQNGLIFIAYVDGQNISFQRGTTSGGVTPSISWVPAQTISTATGGETYTNPSISIASNKLYIGSIFSKNGTKQPKVAISSSTFDLNTLTFSMSNLPYVTRFSLPEIALVPRGTSVLAVIKGTDNEIRSFAYDSGLWQEKGGNISEWGDAFETMNGSVKSIAMYKGDIYIGGTFSSIGISSISNIAKWDGQSWSMVGSGLNGPVFTMAATDNHLFVGGSFTTAGAGSLNKIGKWDGTNWSALSIGAGLDGAVHAILTDTNYVYAGGEFTTADGTTRNRIARWDILNGDWEDLNSGVNGPVYALAKMGTDIFVGGSYTTAGVNINANRIAKWNSNTTQWSALESKENGTVVGDGVNGTVRAITVKDTSLYVGGEFTQIMPSAASTFLAKWYQNSWIPITGLNDAVRAFKVVGEKLYVGGDFTNAGSVPGANRIATYNGSWQSIGGTLNNKVYAIESGLPASNIYIGGLFTSPGNNLALYKTGIIAKAGNFSVTGDSSRTLIAYVKNDTGVPYIAMYLTVWGETQIPGTTNTSAQIQISSKSDDATKYVVTWDLSAGQIYTRTSAGITNTFGTSGSTAPRLPITYETAGQAIPVIWHTSSNFVGVGKSTTP